MNTGGYIFLSFLYIYGGLSGARLLLLSLAGEEWINVATTEFKQQNDGGGEERWRGERGRLQ